MSKRLKPADPTLVSELQRPLWNRSAEAYADVFSGSVSQAIEPTLDAAGIDAGSRVLDVATGPGIIAAAASERGATAKGIDFAENMVAVAQRRYPNIDFTVADATDLPFSDGDFDAVVMGFALFMMAEPDKALREAHRVLSRLVGESPARCGIGRFLDLTCSTPRWRDSFRKSLFSGAIRLSSACRTAMCCRRFSWTRGLQIQPWRTFP